MNFMIERLASAYHADLLRETHDRRLKSLVARCRRRVLGLLSIGPACEARPTC